MSSLQTLILQNIIQDNEFCRKVIPHIKKKYFEGEHRNVFSEVTNFVVKYNKIPDKSSLLIQIEESNISDDRYNQLSTLVNQVYEPVQVESVDWLLDKTERWCQDSACELAVLDAVKILNGEDQKH